MSQKQSLKLIADMQKNVFCILPEDNRSIIPRSFIFYNNVIIFLNRKYIYIIPLLSSQTEADDRVVDINRSLSLALIQKLISTRSIVTHITTPDVSRERPAAKNC